MWGQQKLRIYSVFLWLWITASVHAELPKLRIANTNGLSGQLAFTLLATVGNDVSAESERLGSSGRVFIVNLRSSKIIPIPSAPSLARYASSYPSFSPDGKKVAFTLHKDGKRQIYIEDLASRSSWQVTDCEFSCDNVSWGTGPERLVFYVESQSAKETKLASLPIPQAPGSPPARQSEFQLLTQGDGRDTTPAVSSSGDKLAYSTDRFWPGWDICLKDSVEGEENCVLKGVQSYCRPRFSPDGRYLAYSGGIGDRIAIYGYDLSTRVSRLLVDLPSKDYDIAFMDPDSFFFTSVNGGKDFSVFFHARQKKETKQIVSGPASIRFLSYSAYDATNAQ